MKTIRLSLSVADVNAILALLHAQAQQTGDTALYSRFVAATGRAHS